LGNKSKATGDYSLAIGSGTGSYQSATASSYGSFAGMGSNASGVLSTGIGFLSNATGTRSSAVGGYNNTSSGYGSSIAGGQSNTSAGGNSFIGGGTQNCSNADFSAIIGGAGNSISSTARGGIIGSNCSCISGYFGGAVLNSAAGYSYMAHQLVLGTPVFNVLGGSQSSIVIPYKDTSGVASGNTLILGLFNGNTANSIDPILPRVNSSWHVKVYYTASVTAISGTATGVSVGDTKAQTQELSVKRLAGTPTFVGSTNSGIPMEDASMNTAQMNYAISGVTNGLQPTFTAPTFAGGGTLTLKIQMTMILTEVSW
jgi:hypothetical protein